MILYHEDTGSQKIKYKSHAEQVCEHLRRKIFENVLLPGERIIESEIAESLGLSRTPIREAIRILAAQGLITVSPNRFVKVKTLSNKDIHDLALVRMNLETLAAEYAVRYGCISDFKHLKIIADECKNGIHSMNTHERKDFEFHMTLVSISQNGYLIDLQKELLLKNCLIKKDITQKEVKNFNIANNHYEIIELLSKRYITKAIECIRNHIALCYDPNGIACDRNDYVYENATHIRHTVMRSGREA